MRQELTTEQRLKEEGKYLAALAYLETKLRSATPERSGYLRQMVQQASILCGDEVGARAVASSDPGLASRKVSPSEPLPGIILRDAHAEIIKQAAKYQVVVINEAHDTSRHRAFGATLLPELRRLGFTYFAAETFTAPKVLQTSLANGIVTKNTGYYTIEPVFASYVQTALNLGFTPIAYDSESTSETGTPAERINARETAQASNLYERIFKQNPRAKVVIHVGLSHATRTPDVFEDEGKPVELIWMAGRLTKLLGAPLFTIDQTAGTEVGVPQQDSAVLRGALERFNMKHPSLLQKEDGSFVKAGIGKDCDLTVFHPRFRLRSGRPEWLFQLPGRKEVALPKSVVSPQNGRLLVQAFAEGAPEDAVDIDRFLLTANALRPSLVLPRGRYRLLVQDEEGNRNYSEKVAI